VNADAIKGKIFSLAGEYAQLANSVSISLKGAAKNSARAEKILEKIEELEGQYISAVDSGSKIPEGSFVEGLSEAGVNVPSDSSDELRTLSDSKIVKAIGASWKYFVNGGF
jgi:hypothetical protein